MASALLLASCAPNSKEVVVYASQDQVYAEPILQEFSRRTGVKVRAVYDSEAVKTVGLVNRLLAEKSNPQCDVFWNNEALRTHQLDQRGVLEKWAPFGYRSRRIVINTNLIAWDKAPASLSSLTNAAWRGKVALAYPLFGSTATHFLALRHHWGAQRWEAWCRALHASKPFLLDGNSVVVKFVGRGEAWIGLTDSDDIAAGQREGLPIAALPLTDESLLIPNTVAIVRGARHPQPAQELFRYLQDASVVERLVGFHALEGPGRDATPLASTEGSVASGVATLPPVNWSQLLRDLEAATTTLRDIFLRQ